MLGVCTAMFLFFFTWCSKSFRLLFYPLRRATKHLLWVSNKSLLTLRGCKTWKVKDKLSCMPALPLTNSQFHSITYPFVALPFPQSDEASPLDICYRSICLDQQTCSPLSFAETLHLCAVWILSSLNASRLPFLRNWLSSHCQVRLILSCLTYCYLESHLPEPLNPFVTHSNKKLGRRSLNEDREVEDWWLYGTAGLEVGAGAQAQVHGSVCRSF